MARSFWSVYFFLPSVTLCMYCSDCSGPFMHQLSYTMRHLSHTVTWVTSQLKQWDKGAWIEELLIVLHSASHVSCYYSATKFILLVLTLVSFQYKRCENKAFLIWLHPDVMAYPNPLPSQHGMQHFMWFYSRLLRTVLCTERYFENVKYATLEQASF